jgi:hypothetical protein
MRTPNPALQGGFGQAERQLLGVAGPKAVTSLSPSDKVGSGQFGRSAIASCRSEANWQLSVNLSCADLADFVVSYRSGAVFESLKAALVSFRSVATKLDR